MRDLQNDLSEVYQGRVSYARDAFEGLRLMDATMARRRGELPEVDAAEEAKRAERKARHERSRRVAARRRATEAESAGPVPERSDVATDNPIPSPPFWGTRIVKGLAVAEYAGLVDERALFLGQWGLRGSRAGGCTVSGAGSPPGRRPGCAPRRPRADRGVAALRLPRQRHRRGGHVGRSQGRRRGQYAVAGARADEQSTAEQCDDAPVTDKVHVFTPPGFVRAA